MAAKLKGKVFYEGAEMVAEIVGRRARSKWGVESNIAVIFPGGQRFGGFAYFEDAVRFARQKLEGG